MRTDVFLRALPWAELMLRHPGAFDDLNVGRAELWKATLAGVLVVAIVLALAGVLPAWSPLIAFAAAVLVNRRLAVLFARTNGALFMLAALLFHQLHYLYGAAAYGWCLARRWLAPTRE